MRLLRVLVRKLWIHPRLPRLRNSWRWCPRLLDTHLVTRCCTGRERSLPRNPDCLRLLRLASRLAGLRARRWLHL